MQTKLYILLFLTLTSNILFASVPLNDTIILKTNHVEGRWIHEYKEKDKIEADIYIFRSDYTFHKASDSGELLFFNVAGTYKLSNDLITISYQDFSRGVNTRAKVRKMYLQVIALSEDELNINKTEDKQTSFIRLKRQKNQ